MKTLLKPPTYSFAQSRQSSASFAFLSARKITLYFHLYGLNGKEAGEILATFPIVQRQDEARYGGRCRTHDLILAYLRAYAVGNLAAWVKG